MRLDLHGIKHEFVRSEVICFVEKYLYSADDLYIVTGHSQVMKDIVTEVLDEYKLDYKEGGYMGVNSGYIKVYLCH